MDGCGKYLLGCILIICIYSFMSNRVSVTKYGKCYHRDNCETLKFSRNVHSTWILFAKILRHPCNKCKPNDSNYDNDSSYDVSDEVYVCLCGKCYHNEGCYHLNNCNAKKIKISKARKLGKRACKDCL